MTVLGPGASCCKNASGDCDIECDFDKSATPETQPIEPLQVQEPVETEEIDATQHETEEPVEDEEVVK